MKKLLISSVLATSSLFALTACANVGAATDTSSVSTVQKQYKGGMKGPFSQLDLTATQQAQIKAIMQEKSGAKEGKRGQYKAEREQTQQQIQALTDSKTLNTSTLNRLADQQAAKDKQRFIERVQTQHAISQVLTPEQRTKLAQLKSERKAKGGQRLKNRHATGIVNHQNM